MSQLFTNHVTLIGLGSQGLSWAMNLRDSGFEVDVTLREDSPSQVVCEQLDFPYTQSFSSVILLLIPDNQHLSFLEKNSKHIKAGSAIIYGHGASLVEHRLQEKFPKFNHLLLAPKAIASEVRFQYEIGGKLGACKSVEFALDSDKSACDILIKNLAKGIGITAGPYETSVQDETKADLFSEQALLCGLVPYAAKSAFDFLIEKGIDPKVAYLECWHELKYIAKAMADCGPEDFFGLISPHAMAGADKASSAFFTKKYHSVLEKLFVDIENGTFFKQAKDCNPSKEVIKSWANSKLQEVHNELSEHLIG